MISLLRTQDFTWLELNYGHFFYREVLGPFYFLLCSLPKLAYFHRYGGSPWESLLVSPYPPSASMALSTLAPDKLNRLGGERQPVQRGRAGALHRCAMSTWVTFSSLNLLYAPTKELSVLRPLPSGSLSHLVWPPFRPSVSKRIVLHSLYWSVNTIQLPSPKPFF